MIEFETTRRNHATVIVIYDRTEHLMSWKVADNYATDRAELERTHFLILETPIWRNNCLFIIHFLK